MFLALLLESHRARFEATVDKAASAEEGKVPAPSFRPGLGTAIRRYQSSTCRHAPPPGGDKHTRPCLSRWFPATWTPQTRARSACIRHLPATRNGGGLRIWRVWPATHVGSHRAKRNRGDGAPNVAGASLPTATMSPPREHPRSLQTDGPSSKRLLTMPRLALRRIPTNRACEPRGNVSPCRVSVEHFPPDCADLLTALLWVSQTPH